MEFEMSRFKQFLIEAVGSATFGGKIKSADMGKIGRRLAMANVDFNASEFKKLPFKSFRFSASRMIFTKMMKKEHQEITLVAIEPNENVILVMLVDSRGDYRVIYCNVGELATFTKNKYVGYSTHRTVHAVVEAGNRIEEIINNPETIFYVAENSTEGHNELHAKKSDREAAKEGEDRLVRMNKEIRTKVNMINSKAYKELNVVAKECGYKVEYLDKKKWKWGDNEYVELRAEVLPKSRSDEYLPHIYIERKKNAPGKLSCRVQTTSWGSMSTDKIDQVIDGLQRANKMAKAIESINIEDVIDSLEQPEEV